MFLGSIPKKIAEELSAVKNEKVIVLGSGNYRSEMVLSQNGNLITSTDVSAYSAILGWYFSGSSKVLKVLGEYEIINSLEGAERIAATLQMLEMTQLREIESDKRKKRTMLKLLMDVVKERAQKIEQIKSGMKIVEFQRECMTTVYKRNDHVDKLVLAFPPTYTKGYEKMFAGFNAHLEDTMPPFREIDENVYNELCEDIIKKGKYILYTDRILDVSAPVIKYSEPKKKDVYIYSDYLKRQKYIYAGIPINAIEGMYERATFEDIRENGCQVVYISSKIENYFREVYIKKAVPSTPQNTVSLAVMSGKKIVGFIVYWTKGTNMASIWSDYAVSDAPRVSKLIIKIARTRQAVRLLDQKYVQWTERLRTTVFTDKPVSMKYRGVFELMERKEGRLIYECDVYDNTIEEEVRAWLESSKVK